MTQRTWPPTSHRAPCCSRYFHIFDKIDSFPKQFLNLFNIKKANCIFEELSAVYLIDLLISFFPLLLWIAAENRTKLKKLFIWAANSGETQHQKQTNCTWLLNSNCNNVIESLDWRWYVHYFWLQELVQPQTLNLRTSKKLL